MRYVSDITRRFAEEKFVLISGPRQVGKTTLARAWLGSEEGYFNWDISEHRPLILRKDFAKRSAPLSKIVLDEIHKYGRWKSYLKGLYDEYSRKLQVVVTGSARLDIYKRGGDSLFGRYENVRLHPFSVGEIVHHQVPPPPDDWLAVGSAAPPSLWKELETYSGFPEPFSKQDRQQFTRWCNRRRDLLIQQDIRDISDVREISLLEHLYVLLPLRASQPLSLNGLKEEIQVAFDTISNWLNLFERLYICFRLSPYSGKIGRSLKKEKKLYLWNWAEVESSAARFENMVASHLLKSVDAWNDIGFGDFSLMYWRDKEKREVDFIVTNKGKPIVAIESKLSANELPSSLYDFETKIKQPIPKVLLVYPPGIDMRIKNGRILSADKFFAGLT